MEEQALENHIRKVVYQGLYRVLCTSPGKNLDVCKILTVPPTGKAVYSVKGSTIHAAFNIPVNWKLKYTPSRPDKIHYKHNIHN